MTVGGNLQTTLFSDYSSFVYEFPPLDGNLQTGKPQILTTEIQYPDANAPSGYDSIVQSITYSSYDDYGDPLYSLTTLQSPDTSGSDPIGSALAEGTQYTYSGGLDPRLVASQQTVEASVAPNGASIRSVLCQQPRKMPITRPIVR